MRHPTEGESPEQVTHVSDRHRFELAVDGRPIGVADYVDVGGRRHFVHTEVDPAHGGRGHASALIRHALDETRDEGLGVVAECSFVAAYIGRHEEYQDLVG